MSEFVEAQKQTLFDVTMGSFDRAEACKLGSQTGVFMLNNLARFFKKHTVGQYMYMLQGQGRGRSKKCIWPQR